MKFPGRRARVSAVITLGILVLLAVPVVDQFVFRHSWADSTLQEIESRHARLLGLRESAPRLKSTLAEMGGVLERYAYPEGTGVDRIGADLQQRFRRVAEANGLVVAGSQILPPKAAKGMELVSMSATLDAGIGGLRDFLLALGLEKPSIQVDSLNITANRQRGSGAEEKNLRVQINVSAIHLLP